MELNKEYWEKRWSENRTQWDIGSSSTPLIEYASQIANKNAKILIPGCGNAYELKALLNIGFTDITVIDIADQPIANLIEQYPHELFPNLNILLGDFFDLTEAYDIILEQTFFCALPRDQRVAYAEKMQALLAQRNGKLVGVLFDKEFNHSEPPYGGTVSEYKSLFEQYFSKVIIEPCYNSIPPRAGAEVFFRCWY